MISNLYFLAMTTLKKFHDESDFKDYLLNSFPESIIGKLPPGATLNSIVYEEDILVSGVLELISNDGNFTIQNMKNSGFSIEKGVYHIELEGPDNYELISLPGIEDVIKEILTEFSFISSYFYYLNENGFNVFSKLHTFISEEEDDEVNKDLINSFAPIFKSYFYDNYISDDYIADNYIDKVALIYLLGCQE